MDTEYILMLLKIIGALVIILPIIYIVLRFGGTNLQKLQQGKYIQMLERVSITKENQLIILKLGKNGYVMASTNGKIEILQKLEESELKELEAKREFPKYKSVKEMLEKLLKKKEDKDE